MPALTPSFVADLETRMQVQVESEYARLLTNIWWPRVAKVHPSTGRKDVLTWLLDTVQFYDQGKTGGSIRFEDVISAKLEAENRFRGTGLKLTKQQLTDTDGGGVDLAQHWATGVGAMMAYSPQLQFVNLLKGGESTADGDGYIGTGYDNLPLFSAVHPNDGNPNGDTSHGVFSNIITSVDISAAVNRDVALANLTKVWSTVGAIKMPNGAIPRYLKPSALICGPALYPLAVQLTKAKFLAEAAGTSGGGAADVTDLIAALGYQAPIYAPELSGFESDTTYFVVAEQAASSPTGGVVYIEREPYAVKYYTGSGGGTGVDAVLDRAKELEWHVDGRNIFVPGHPYMIFKCKA